MPGRDGTGPLGNGPLTGRGSGYCVKRIDLGAGQELGFGRSIGRGNRCLGKFLATDSNGAASGKALLQKEKQLLQERLEIINIQLEDK